MDAVFLVLPPEDTVSKVLEMDVYVILCHQAGGPCTVCHPLVILCHAWICQSQPLLAGQSRPSVAQSKYLTGMATILPHKTPHSTNDSLLVRVVDDTLGTQLCDIYVPSLEISNCITNT